MRECYHSKIIICSLPVYLKKLFYPCMLINKKKFISLSATLILLYTLNAQQLPLYSDYIMNGFYINPAMAGSEGYTAIGISSRDQWAGLPNSPQTDVAGVQWRILREDTRVTINPLTQERGLESHSGRVGLGIYIFNDQNGLIQRTGAQFSYAYHVFINNRQLSFGLGVNTFQFSISTDQFSNSFKQTDPLYYSGFANKVLLPDATAGIYLLSYDSFYGFSIANLFQTPLRIGSSSYDYRINRTYYIMGGQRFHKDEMFSFEPSILIQGTENTVVQANLQVREYYNQYYYFGLVYRTGSAIAMQIGLKWERLYFNYNFDYTLTAIQTHTIGSHELNIVYKLGDSARRYKWLIRY